MIDAPLIFLGGLLGSAHCVGMCGGFVLTLSVRGEKTSTELARQMVYAAGRVCTYTCGGAVAGYAGLRLTHSLSTIVQVQGWLCILAGVCLLWQGSVEAGVLPRRLLTRTRECGGATSMFAAIWQAARWQNTFLAGAINGFLPCGLVYAFLALAGSSGGIWSGAAIMALFGAGTVPTLALFGAGGGCMSQPLRRKLVTIAAWCVLVTGVLSIGRGITFIYSATGENAVTSCPLCSKP